MVALFAVMPRPTHVDGSIGFPNQQATAWDAFSGRPECVNEITEFLQVLDEELRLRSAAMRGADSRFAVHRF